MIHPTAIIYNNVVIGANVNIGAYCIIGSEPEIKNEYGEVNKGVIIKAGTNITGNVTIDGGSKFPTMIGEGCFIMKGVHIGHDCHIENNVVISAGATLAGHCMVMENATIGIGSNIHQFSLIGGGAMIGAGSVVIKTTKTEPLKTYAGNPIKEISENIYIKNKLSEEKQLQLKQNYKYAKDSGLFSNIK